MKFHNCIYLNVKKGSGAPQTHPTSLVETLSKAYLAAKAAAKPGETYWCLKSDSTLPLVGSKLMVLYY